MSREYPLVISEFSEQTVLIEDHIRRELRQAGPVRILEAGCGRKWPLDLKGIEHTLTGLDIDKAALDIRKNVTRDLDDTIHGDLRYADLGTGQFDVIYSSYVLEHIKEAEAVLQNFSRWLRKGGLLILLIPDADSVRGFITRITPHWFHVLYYRYVLRLPNAGKSGYGPYVTYYAPVVSRHGIRQFCEQHHFRISEERGSGSYLGHGLVAVLSRALARVIAWLSLGRLKDNHADLMYILKKD
jgi:SAM-dependent methyltransferase